jgi:hypothetical protein
MTTPDMSDSEVLAALEAWKSQQSQLAEHGNLQTTAASTSTPMSRGRPSLTEILAQEGLIDPQANTGELDPTILQVILDL